jgi:hypothetical protein
MITQTESLEQLRSMITTATKLLNSARVSTLESHCAKTENELIGTIFDAPQKLREAATLIEAIIILAKR